MMIYDMVISYHTEIKTDQQRHFNLSSRRHSMYNICRIFKLKTRSPSDTSACCLCSKL